MDEGSLGRPGRGDGDARLARALGCGAVLVASPGARATEAALVAAVREHATAVRAAAAPGAPPGALAALLAAPLRVVVPSRSLREHAAARLARALGGGAAGVVVQTLRRLATEVLERAGVELAGAEAVFPVIVRREARREPALRAALEPLHEGYAAVAGSVADLLDAGFEPVHGEAAFDAIAEAAAAPDARARAEALVRVAARTLRALEGIGLSHRSRFFARAAELLEERRELLPAQGVVLHGFADATGAAGALLEALVRQRGALVLLDAPPDPADPGTADAGVAFSERLRSRLALAGARAAASAGVAPAAAEVRLREAPGAEAEVRAVAASVRGLLDQGVEPERIGVVARELAIFAAPLRRHLRRLGIPFSGAPDVASVALPGARALHALLALLRERGEVPVDAWLAARAGGAAAGGHGRDDALDLRVAFHALGAGRLAEAGALDVEARLRGRAWLSLPVGHGLAAARAEGDDADVRDGAAEGEDPRDDARESEDAREASGVGDADRSGRAARGAGVGGGSAALDAVDADRSGSAAPDTGDASGGARGRGRRRLQRRSVPAWLLERTVSDARASLAALAALDARAGFAAHRGRLELLLLEGLRWHRSGSASRALARAQDDLADELPDDFELDGAELALLLERALAGAEAEPLGGAGGGVAVLSVTEARAHTFDAIFLLGVGRDAFPRRVTEDALLPDALRRSLESVLPEIPLKARGYDEERYLFAQLLSSSPRVAVSWQSASDDGRARAASPFVERLHLAGGVPEAIPALFSEADPARALRPAFEHAILAGLRGGDAEREAAYALALEEARREEGASAGVPALALARARRAAREEWDAPPGARTLGPYLGFVGRRGAAASRLFVTQLEAFARCPWRAFLERELHLAPLPDALAWRPGPDRRLEGSAVHAALEALVRAAVALPEDDALAAALGRAPSRLVWPDAASAGRIVRDAVARVLDDDGIGLPGYLEALAQLIEPSLARAQLLLGGAARVVAAEAQGAASIGGVVPGAPLALHFRADLVERGVDGEPILTDYKNGTNSIAKGSKPAKRRSELVASIAKGLALQAMTYAHAAPGATGRYLFLGPDVGEDEREVAVRADDAELSATFTGALRALLAARSAGLRPPRLLSRDGAKGATRCGYCEVRDACVRGDSGARARLRAWLEEPASGTRGAPGITPVDAPGIAPVDAPGIDPALESALRELWQRGDA